MTLTSDSRIRSAYAISTKTSEKELQDTATIATKLAMIEEQLISNLNQLHEVVEVLAYTVLVLEGKLPQPKEELPLLQGRET
jgi:acetolactate synthase small subunit